MKKLLLSTAITFAFVTGVTADVGHATDAPALEIGAAGDLAKVDRTIDVILLENDDGEMLIQSEEMNIKQGETILFKIKNVGELEHEFVVDTVDNNAVHKIEMAKMVMEHDEPNRIHLDAGASGEVIWTFANAGTFEAACLIPGHYESGMFREVVVGEMMAQAEVVYTTGTVTKVDTKSGKVTIDHGPLLNLDMPAMKMVFRADEEMISKMSDGQAIEFVAEPVKGKLTIVKLK